jgi:hypothetical protein
MTGRSGFYKNELDHAQCAGVSLSSPLNVNSGFLFTILNVLSSMTDHNTLALDDTTQ